MTARVALRPMQPSDLRLVRRMAAAFNDEDGHPLSAAGKRALTALCEGTPHGLGYMIEHEGRPVGYVIVGLGFSVEYGGIDGFLDELYVEGAHRGRGFGTAALLKLHKVAKTMKIRALHLEAMPENHRAAKLYERVGYALSSRRLMSKRL